MHTSDPSSLTFEVGGKAMRTAGMILRLSVVVMLFSLSVIAQTITSTIEGTVTDPNGAVVSGATVKATGTTLVAERTATTNDEGVYRLTALPAGTYTVTVSASGFTVSTANVELTVNKVAQLDVRLEIEGRTGQVTVTNEIALLEPNR